MGLSVALGQLGWVLSTCWFSEKAQRAWRACLASVLSYSRGAEGEL